ncbi:hypothetical protein BDV95DRAFT_502273 [Massariosphaeria phaeospora]|uniref:NAD-dependent epimerase/dehydratase domain-containing protein n=1 Tax=Massariosphaeria phaeospora TaxID=100035 RepID=A0A7C8M4P9_9PLEO|nr:hypothetical protein BDV95DRAFT_502273 [Massariosphaeria phaeospora]
MLRVKVDPVDILVLGAGWTSTFLIPQLDSEKISHAETTTTGSDGTIPFKFDPDADDVEPFTRLPAAHTVLITFPLKGHGQSKRITALYRQAHGEQNQWMQLGSTGIFNQTADWTDEDAPYDRTNARAIAEDELRECVDGMVLNLAGLYGGQRKPSNWLSRIAQSKADVQQKKAVHFIHGDDVARAIVAAHRNFTPGKRWIVADLRVYDWYDLILSFSGVADEAEDHGGGDDEAAEGKRRYGKWVAELMAEEGVAALPRSPHVLGRKLDSRGFWSAMGAWPHHARLA